MKESDNERRLKRKKYLKEFGLFLLLIAFITVAFSLWNYFGFVAFTDAKVVIRDFERNYLYSEVIKSPEYIQKRNAILAKTITSKKEISSLIDFVKIKANDQRTTFKYINIFEGKFKYSKNIKLDFQRKSESGNVGYIKFNTFSADANKKFLKAIDKFKEKKYLVLDLRDNYTGDYNYVSGITDNLLGENAEMFYIESPYSRHYFTSDPYVVNFTKIFVLLNENSGYGSEMLALALKENMGDRVELIGHNVMNDNLGQYFVSYYNKIEMNITSVKWSVKGKTAADLNNYLAKYSKIKLDKLDDYMSLVNDQIK